MTEFVEQPELLYTDGRVYIGTTTWENCSAACTRLNIHIPQDAAVSPLGKYISAYIRMFTTVFL